MAAPTMAPGKSWVFSLAVTEANTPELEAELLARLSQNAKANGRTGELTLAILRLLTPGSLLGGEISQTLSAEVVLEERIAGQVEEMLPSGDWKPRHN